MRHEETVGYWRAMHAEEKRKKQVVSDKLSEVIRERDALRDALEKADDRLAAIYELAAAEAGVWA